MCHIALYCIKPKALYFADMLINLCVVVVMHSEISHPVNVWVNYCFSLGHSILHLYITFCLTCFGIVTSINYLATREFASRSLSGI